MLPGHSQERRFEEKDTNKKPERSYRRINVEN